MAMAVLIAVEAMRVRPPSRLWAKLVCAQTTRRYGHQLSGSNEAVASLGSRRLDRLALTGLDVSAKCTYTCRTFSWEGRGHPMGTISIRDLQRNTSGVVADVADSKHTALVTRHGEPIAALVPIDAQDLEDYLLSKVPGFAEDMAAADQAHAQGEARSAADVFAELDVQDAGQ